MHDGTDTYPLVPWLPLRRKLQYSNIGLVAAWLQIESQTSLPFFAVNWSNDDGDADSNSYPNWGGRCEGSGRKKHAPMLPVTALPKAPCWHNRTSLSFFPHLCQCWQIQFHTTQTQYQPVNSSTPAQGFFAPRNCFQESRTRRDNLNEWTGLQGLETHHSLCFILTLFCSTKLLMSIYLHIQELRRRNDESMMNCHHE